jgi:hypothetical protein
LFSLFSARDSVHARLPSACGMRSYTRALVPRSVRTTTIVPASRSPFCRTLAKPPSAPARRISAPTSRCAGRRGSPLRRLPPGARWHNLAGPTKRSGCA